MAYVESIGVLPGQSVEDAIDLYLDLNKQGLTTTWTVVKGNTSDFPIGYFDEDTIDLFKLGITTVNNIIFLVNRGHEPLDSECQVHTNYFIEQLLEKYKDLDDIPSILRSFEEISKNSGNPLFTEEQWDYIKEQIASRKLEENHEKGK